MFGLHERVYREFEPLSTVAPAARQPLCPRWRAHLATVDRADAYGLLLSEQTH
jgi:hypothetical protein